MIEAVCGAILGGLAGYVLARILMRYGIDPVGPDARTEGRLKLLESASLRHGASIKVLLDRTMPPEGHVQPSDIVWTQADEVTLVIPADEVSETVTEGRR